MSKTKEEIIKEFNKKVESAKINFDSYLENLSREFLNELKMVEEKEKNRFKVELPENDTEVYFINDYDNTINFDDFQESSEDDETRFRNGMLFESAEEAEKFLKERRLLFKIKKWAEIHNNGWKPDWLDMRQSKYFVICDMYANNFIIHNAGVFKYMTNDLPYFRTNEIARQFIKEFGKEIKEVLL